MVFLSSRLVSQLAKSQYAFTTCSSCTIRQSTARLFSGGSGGEGFHTPQSPPPLFDLILRSDWNAALKRVEQYPREAHYRHPRGFTMLHCAVEFKGLTPLEHTDPAAFARVVHINLTAPWWLSQACLPLLKQSGDAALVFAQLLAAPQPLAAR